MSFDAHTGKAGTLIVVGGTDIRDPMIGSCVAHDCALDEKEEWVCGGVLYMTWPLPLPPQSLNMYSRLSSMALIMAHVFVLTGAYMNSKWLY